LTFPFLFQAHAFLGTTNDLFTGELDEVLLKVSGCLKTLHAFRQTYKEHKAKLETYLKEGVKANKWEFADALVFARYDKVVERIETLKVCLIESTHCCMKLCIGCHSNDLSHFSHFNDF